jgi:uncharacterized membrane protein YeiB
MNSQSYSSLNTKPARIELADALRGFALVSIVLLHNVEHYDCYFRPEGLPHWLKILDSKLWDSIFFLFSGKSYAIFALLFGFSFFIQFDNQEKKGLDFRGRFLWRLSLLLVLGIFNSIFYSGDILAFYAIIGVTLVPVCKWEQGRIYNGNHITASTLGMGKGNIHIVSSRLYVFGKFVGLLFWTSITPISRAVHFGNLQRETFGTGGWLI